MNSSYLSSPKVFFFQFCVAMSPCRHVATSVRQCLNLKIYKNLFLRSIATVPQYTVFIQSSGKRQVSVYKTTRIIQVYQPINHDRVSVSVKVLHSLPHFSSLPHVLFKHHLEWRSHFFLSFFLSSRGVVAVYSYEYVLKGCIDGTPPANAMARWQVLLRRASKNSPLTRNRPRP